MPLRFQTIISTSASTSISGIQLALQDQFTAGRGDRPNVPNVMVIITDGRQEPGSNVNPIPLAQQAQDAGITVLTFGVGDAVPESELSEMSSFPRR